MPPCRRPRTSKEERICAICTRAFNKAEHLARHVRSHTKEKPFRCELCSREYSRQDTLLRHGRSHAGDQLREELMTDSVPEALDASNTSSCQPIPGIDSCMTLQNVETTVHTDDPHPHRHSSVEDCDSLTQNQFMPVPARTLMTMAERVNVFSHSNDLPRNPESHEEHFRFPEQPEDDSNNALTTLANSSATVAPANASSIEINGNSSSQFDNSWAFLDPSLETQWPTWFAGDDFNLAAFNDSIITSTSNLDYATEHLAPEHSPKTFDFAALSKPEELIRRKWFTFSNETGSGNVTPDPVQRTRVDEACRRDLAAKLQPRVQSGTLPSTEFLNHCIQAYFVHFHPIFPIIHAPTFRASAKNSLLLLSMCSVGSLFLGSTKAAALGTNMLERLNKSILASWDVYIVKNRPSCSAALQASLIGQTFGLLSGRPRDLVMVDIFHGSVIAWARRLRLFQKESAKLELDGLCGDSLTNAWKDWIEAEEQIRIVLGLYVHDSEIARLFHHSPTLRHDIGRLPFPSSDELFAAPTAASWKSLRERARKLESVTGQRQTPQPTSPSLSVTNTAMLPDISNRFASYAILESIATSSCETREPQNRWLLTAQQCRDSLITWFNKYQKDIDSNHSDHFCLMILWHSIFMSLHADFDRLECACGREGYDVAQAHRDYASEWARSADAKRCLLHAILIQKGLENLRVGTEPAIHVSISLYLAGMAWYCYAYFGVDGDCVPDVSEDLDFPELRLLGTNGTKLISEASGFQFGRPASSSLYKLINLLQRVGNWGLPRSFSSTLLAIVEGGGDVFRLWS